MSVKTEPKFQVGQIAVLKHSKKTLPFVILEAVWNDGWFYKWNKRNAASEHMVRGLTPEEVGKSVCENCDDLTHLFELQNTRMDKATKLWRDATGKHDTLPDLGSLLDWLMETRTMIPPEPREPAAREADNIDAEINRHHSALIGKIQAVVDKAFPNDRWSDYDVLNQGVWKILERAEAAESSLKDQTFWADQYHKAAVASEASLVKARKDVAHWKANHDDQKRRKQNVSRKLSELIKKNRAKKASTSAPEGTV